MKDHINPGTIIAIVIILLSATYALAKKRPASDGVR